MNLITAKCPDCGADLKIPEGSLSVTCEYCGSQVIVTDVLGTGSVMQNCMTLAYAALEANNYTDAYQHFNTALELDINSYTAWFGKAICTGRTGKLIDLRIDEMIKLFENAFKYAPADKQANIRRNAASEIVKAIKAQKEKFNEQQMFLGEMKQIDQGTDYNLSEIEGWVMKVRQEFLGALDKAHEYDPSNTDIAPLKNELTQAVAVSPEPIIPDGQKISTQFGNLAEQISKQETPAAPPVQPVVNEKKKSGCAVMSVIVIFIIFACVGAAILLLLK